jgi:hypothetical protein
MYDPLEIDAFIKHYETIAPLAVRAGQEARRVFTAEPDQGSPGPLHQIRATASESALLMQFVRTIEECSSQTDTIDAVAQFLRRLTPATTYAIYRFEPQGDNLVCAATSGDPDGLLNGLSIPAGERVPDGAAANARTAVNSDASLDLARISSFFTPALRSMVATPVGQNQVIAVLSGYSSKELGFYDTHRLIFEQAAAGDCRKNRQHVLRSSLESRILPHSKTLSNLRGSERLRHGSYL